MIILLIQFEIYLDLLAWDKIILYICTRSYNNVNPKQSKTMETKLHLVLVVTKFFFVQI